MIKRKFKIYLLLIVVILCSGFHTENEDEDIERMLYYAQRNIIHYYYIYFRYPTLEELIEYHEKLVRYQLEGMHKQEVKYGNTAQTLRFLKKNKKQIQLVPENDKLLFYYREGVWEYDMDYCKDKNRHWDNKMLFHQFSTFDKNGKYRYNNDENTWFEIRNQLSQKFPVITPYIQDGDTTFVHLFHYDRKEGLSFICYTEIDLTNDDPYVKELIFSLDTFMNNRKEIHSIHFLANMRESGEEVNRDEIEMTK